MRERIFGYASSVSRNVKGFPPGPYMHTGASTSIEESEKTWIFLCADSFFSTCQKCAAGREEEGGLEFPELPASRRKERGCLGN